MRVALRLFIIGTICVTLQWLFFGRLTLWGATPDVVLLFVLWVAIGHGQVTGALVGFFAGFALDMVYGLWGINMFVKTLIGFLVGYLNLINLEVFERSVRRVVELSLVVALMHNVLLSFFVLLQGEASWLSLIWSVCVGSTLYTALVAFISAAIWSR